MFYVKFRDLWEPKTDKLPVTSVLKFSSIEEIRREIETLGVSGYSTFTLFGEKFEDFYEDFDMCDEYCILTNLKAEIEDRIGSKFLTNLMTTSIEDDLEVEILRHQQKLRRYGEGITILEIEILPEERDYVEAIVESKIQHAGFSVKFTN